MKLNLFSSLVLIAFVSSVSVADNNLPKTEPEVTEVSAKEWKKSAAETKDALAHLGGTLRVLAQNVYQEEVKPAGHAVKETALKFWKKVEKIFGKDAEL
ncbi:MAG: hypothetical protein V4534_01960 [Myxococcota bacterium]